MGQEHSVPLLPAVRSAPYSKDLDDLFDEVFERRDKYEEEETQKLMAHLIRSFKRAFANSNKCIGIEYITDEAGVEAEAARMRKAIRKLLLHDRRLSATERYISRSYDGEYGEIQFTVCFDD